MNVVDLARKSKQYLHALHQEMAGSGREYADLFSLGARLGLAGRDTIRVVSFLSAQCLITSRGPAHLIGLTPLGAREAVATELPHSRVVDQIRALSHGFWTG